MRKFSNIAKLIKSGRKKKGLSQEQLTRKMGGIDTRAQFISNIERGLCNLPWKHVNRTCEILEIPVDDVITAMCDDHLMNLQEVVYGRRDQA